MTVAFERFILRIAVARFVDERGQPPEIGERADILGGAHARFDETLAVIVLVSPDVTDLFLQFFPAQGIERGEIFGGVAGCDAEVIERVGHGVRCDGK